MKKLIIFFCVIINLSVFSQEFECSTDESEIPELRSGECNNTLNYFPDNFTAHKRIKLNFHFISDENGNYNFNAQDDGLGNQGYSGEFVSDRILFWLNHMVSNNGSMNLYLGQDPPPVLAHNYSFIMNQIYYHNHATLYEQGGLTNLQYANSLNSTFGADLGEVVNVYWVLGNGGFATFFQPRYVVNRGLWQGHEQSINNNGNPEDNFYEKAHLLNHEIGHNLSLRHTIVLNSSGNCPDLEDYCSDTPMASEMISINGSSSCCGWNTANIPTCTNNLMDYGFGMVLSPEQLGRAHYTLSTDMIPYIYKDDFCENEINDAHTIFNGESLTWEAIKILDRNLIIENGAELVIKCKVYMPKNAKIIVEPGGKLVVDEDGVVTTFCNDFWQGIEVHGNRNLTQTPENQGIIEVRNGGMVEYALNGIRTIERKDNGNFDWTKTGGIVRIFDGTFKDCKRGIEFMSYQNLTPTGIEITNKSFVNNTSFITTDDYLNNDIPPYTGISLYDVNGIKINNCIFENQRTDLTTVVNSERGSGIVSVDANYRVTSRYNIFTGAPIAGSGNEFRNLYYGVMTSGGTGRSDVIINDNLFEECIYGVGLKGCNYGIIGRNEFNLLIFNNSGNAGYGVYTDGAYGFNIEGNTFSTVSASNVNHHATNVRNSSTNASSGKVYRNTINNAYIGTQTIGENSTLKIDCNTYNKGKSSSVDVHHANGVLGDQGDCGALFGIPANNMFDGPCNNNNLAHIFKNPVATDFLYSHQENTLNTSCHNLGGFALQCDFSLQNECPNELANDIIRPKPVRIKNWKSKLTLTKEQLEEVYDILASGDAEELITSIENDSPGDTKEALLAASPYLSDRVLIAYLTQDPTPPVGHINEVLHANSPLTDTVMSILNMMSLPNGIQNEINNVQEGVSERRLLEGSESVLNTNRLIYVDAIVQEYLDTNWIDSAALFLEQEGSLEALCALVPIEVRRRDTTRANTIIDALRNIATEMEDNEPGCTRSCELNEYCDFQQSVFRIALREGGYFSITPEERTALELMASSDARIAVNAEAILHFLDETLPEYEGEELVFPKSMVTKEEVDELLKNSTNDLFSVHPNPSSGAVVFTIDKKELNGLEIIITDLQGKVMKIINVNGHEVNDNLGVIFDGVYLVHLVEKGEIQSTKKLIYAK